MDTTSTLEAPHTLIIGAPGKGIVKSSSAPRSKHHYMLQEIPNLDAQAMDMICSACGENLSWWEWFQSRSNTRETQCYCGKTIPRRFGRALPAHQEQAVQTPGYFDRVWYHATRTPNWAETVQTAEDGELLVHAGSKLSALSRADDLNRGLFNRSPIYLYSFELHPDALIPTTVYDDLGEDWPNTSGEGLSLPVCALESNSELYGNRWELVDPSYSGAAYYNRYELPGEISLIFEAAAIDLASVKVAVI